MPGEAVEPRVREELGHRFGDDLGDVRVHTGDIAAEAARLNGARAFTLGRHMVFGAGEYRPREAVGRRLLAHELTHAVQQRGATIPSGRLEVSRPTDRDEREAASVDPFGAGPIAATSARPRIARETPGEIASKVAEKEDTFDPEASGGIGDFPAAFKLIAPLDSDTLLQVLVELQKNHHLDLLRANVGLAGRDRSRVDTLAAAVQHATHRIPDAELALMPSRVAGLDEGTRDSLNLFFARYPRHVRDLFLKGPDAELDRLAKLKADELTATAKAEADAEKKRLEEEAKKTGMAAPPSPAPDSSKVLEKQVKTRAIQPLPTAPWDSLTGAEKTKWNTEHAPRVIREIQADIAGTELEDVMKGKGWDFKPKEVLEAGGYAYQSGKNFTFGMSFVKDVIDPNNPKRVATPKNARPIVAHEMGGHFEYGDQYAKAIMERVLKKLPPAEQAKYSDPEMRRQFFTAFAYAETEIFAALRQRRYANPEVGPAPTYGALDPDTNIERRLNQIDTGFPSEVGRAIIVELKWKLDAASQILERDKKYFAAQIKKHGWSIP